jgi:hypothetical protein
MCCLLPFCIAIVCLIASVYLLLSRFPIRPTTDSFPFHWCEKFRRTVLKISQSVATMPDYCSTTMAQVAFMAAKSHGNLDISSVILLDTGCSQHTFCNKTDFKEIRYFQPHETSHGITGIGKTFFQPVGVGTVKIDCSVRGRRH